MNFWNINLGLSFFDNKFLCHGLPLIEFICPAACVGPTDSNTKETMNTLKYANWTHNI